MKKILLALTMITLPVMAHAAPQKTISNATIQISIKRFRNAMCPALHASFAEELKRCYQTTKITDPKIDQCILADVATTPRLIKDPKMAKIMQEDIPYLTAAAFKQRIHEYIIPRYKTANHAFSFLKPGIEPFSKGVFGGNVFMECINKEAAKLPKK